MVLVLVLFSMPLIMKKPLRMVIMRHSNRRPIMSVKKVIDAQGGLVASTVSTVGLLNVTTGAAWVDSANDSVPIGCTVSSMYISVFVFLDGAIGATTPVIDWFFAKSPGNSLTFPEPGATGGNENRRWIMHEEKGLAPSIDDGGTPMVFKGVLKIPKGRQRMGNDDSVFISLKSEGHPGFFCVKAIYKFYQ